MKAKGTTNGNMEEPEREPIRREIVRKKDWRKAKLFTLLQVVHTEKVEKDC